MPPNARPGLLQAADEQAAPDDELLQAHIEISAGRGHISALQAELAERDRRLADLTQSLSERERTIARLQATLPLRLAAQAGRVRRSIAEAVRRLGRRYVSPQTRNRIVRRYPWLQRAQARVAAPLSSVPAVGAVAPVAVPTGPDAGTMPRLASYDVICLPAIEWQARATRPQALAAEFARLSHRVYYVNPVSMLLASTGRSYTSSALSDGVWDIRLAASRRPLIYRETLDAASVRTMAAGLDQLRRSEQIASALLLVSFPSWAPLALDLQRRFGWTVVYDCIDDWQSVEAVHKPALDQEEQLVRSAALVLTAGPRLQEKWRAYNPRTEMMRNGIYPEEITRGCRPNELLAAIPHPLIGCLGTITPRLDLELVRQVAGANPQWQFVFVGSATSCDVSPLRALANVHMLDAVAPDLAPAYIYNLDACLMPLRQGRMPAADMTRFYEYMSAGKPVVAPPLDDLRPYAQHYYSASDVSEYAAQLGRAMSEASPTLARRRSLLGNANSWSQRVQRISTMLTSACPRVSMVIVTYNNVALTRQCIESIYRNTTYPVFEVIVVDNASSDGTRPYLAHASRIYANLHVIGNSENQGFARACNAGIRIAHGEHVVFLNNDTVTPRGWLERLLRYLADPQVGLVGPVTNATGNEARIATSYQTMDEMEAFAAAYCEEHAGQSFDIAVCALFCAAARRELLDRIGLLDEQFEVGMFEDDDLAQRVRRAGLRVVCAEDAFVHHVGEAAFKKLPQDEYQRVFDANRARFEQKWQTSWQPHVGRGTS